ncbi:hypothetical protein [Nocardia brasiliensis]|uniref:hypothetical protein n=1 Tax=Nocardia brasiliensis TaxID=37326 RepID=UPI002455AF58|nr:hypothetical protein [Nocardia brasiliensis]
MNGTATINTLLNHIAAWSRPAGFAVIVIAGVWFFVVHVTKNKFGPAAIATALVTVVAAAVIVWYLPSFISVGRNSGNEITGLNPGGTGGTYGLPLVGIDVPELPDAGAA